MNRLKILASAILIMTGLLTVTLGMVYAQNGDVNNDNAMVGNGSNQPTPPVLMPEGTITQVFVNGTEDGSMVVSHMVGNTTLNIEIHPPTEEKEKTDIVVLELDRTSVLCRIHPERIQITHIEDSWAYHIEPDSSIMMSSDRIVDHGRMRTNEGSPDFQYVIFDISINEDMTAFEGHGVVFSNNVVNTCGGDPVFPIRISGPCGAGMSFQNGTSIDQTPGTFLMEGLSADSYNVTAEVPTYTTNRSGHLVEAEPEFYSYCYRR